MTALYGKLELETLFNGAMNRTTLQALQALSSAGALLSLYSTGLRNTQKALRAAASLAPAYGKPELNVLFYGAMQVSTLSSTSSVSGRRQRRSRRGRCGIGCGSIFGGHEGADPAGGASQPVCLLPVVLFRPKEYSAK